MMARKTASGFPLHGKWPGPFHFLPVSLTIALLATAVLLLLALLMADGAKVAEGEIITVDDDYGKGDYNRIQDAINAAGAGDTIRINDGIYSEQINVDRPVSLVGNGSDETVLAGCRIRLNVDNVNLTDFRMLGEGGIDVFSEHNRIENLNLSINRYGIFLRSSRDNVLTGNIFTGCGIFMEGFLEEHWDSHDIDSTNLVNGKPVRYYSNAVGLTVPQGAGQVILADCSKVKVREQICFDSYAGICLAFTENSTVESNNCSYNGAGIYLFRSHNNTLSNNTCTGNDGEHGSSSGIYLIDSDSNAIKGNNCSYNGNSGIFLSGSNYYFVSGSSYGGGSSFNKLSDNICEGNRAGISMTNSDSNELSGNKCFYNSNYGFETYRSDYTVFSSNDFSYNAHSGGNARYSDHNTYRYNRFSYNQFQGLKLDRSDHCTVEDNTFHHNKQGLHLYHAEDTELSGNEYYDNEKDIEKEEYNDPIPGFEVAMLMAAVVVACARGKRR